LAGRLGRKNLLAAHKELLCDLIYGLGILRGREIFMATKDELLPKRLAVFPAPANAVHKIFEGLDAQSGERLRAARLACIPLFVEESFEEDDHLRRNGIRRKTARFEHDRGRRGCQFPASRFLCGSDFLDRLSYGTFGHRLPPFFNLA
jgi:hypothetical protein